MKNSHDTPKVDWTQLVDWAKPFPVTTEIITDLQNNTITFLPEMQATVTHVTYYMPDGSTITKLTEDGLKQKRLDDYNKGGTKFSGQE